jgi:hydroxymethylbilane synthase
MTLRLGTRGSRLALYQAELVKRRLEELHPGLAVEIRILQTTGDRITDVPLAKIGDKGLFTKELDRAILSGEVDAAVHSLKDMPTVLVDGLIMGAVLDREDPRDVLVPAPGRPRTLAELPAGARIGTSSLRRRAQLRHSRPDLIVADLRGNLDTRFGRLRDGHFDAAILAHAGVSRLGHEDMIGEILTAPTWLPAAGQGALGIAVGHGDERTIGLISSLDDEIARATTAAERAFLRALEGGCQIPIGAFATLEEQTLRLFGLVAAIDGDPLLRGEAVGDLDRPEELGRQLAAELLEQGAGEILDSIRSVQENELPHASAP